jgi:hypothetical protein
VASSVAPLVETAVVAVATRAPAAAEKATEKRSDSDSSLGTNLVVGVVVAALAGVAYKHRRALAKALAEVRPTPEYTCSSLPCDAGVMETAGSRGCGFGDEQGQEHKDVCAQQTAAQPNADHTPFTHRLALPPQTRLLCCAPVLRARRWRAQA